MTQASTFLYSFARAGIVLLFLCGSAKATTLSPNVRSVLNSPFVMPKIGSLNTPPDISYLFVDLKFDGTILKICEFGAAPYAGQRPTSVIINGQEEHLRSPYWQLFWEVIKKYDLPFWWIGGEIREHIQELKDAGGRYALGLASIERDPVFKASIKNAKQDPKQIKDCVGIVVFSGPEQIEHVAAFRKKYPNVLFVNRHMRNIVCFKDFSYPIFKELNLSCYKPRCGVYPKKYDMSLAEKIKQDLDTNFFIIKPVNSKQANGVIMTSAEELDSTLQLIIQNSEILKKSPHRSLYYWGSDESKEFVVEAYAPSKTIFVDGKSYDPTMRLVFCLMHEQGVITIHVIGGFWKLTGKSLDEEASLTDLHITVPGIFGVPIEPDDMQKAKKLLVDMLVPFYSYLLDSE